MQDTKRSVSWVHYSAKAPDPSRWYEYIMTSPFQIVLVAICFHVRESKFLIVLAMLQVALVAMGYPIECELQRFATHKTLKRESAEDKFDKTSLCILLVVAWAIHFVIWGSIWSQQADESA